MKKVTLLFLPLLMMAVSCASTPQNNGVEGPELVELAAAIVEPEPADISVLALEQEQIEASTALAIANPSLPEMAAPYITDVEATTTDNIPDALPFLALAEVTEIQQEEQSLPEVALEEPVFYESTPPDVLPAEDFIANSLMAIDLAEPVFPDIIPEPELVPPTVVAQEPVPPPVAVPAPQPIPPQQVPAQIPAPTPQPLPPPVEHLAAATPATVWEHIPIMPEIPNPVPDFLGLPDIIPLADSPVAFSRVVHARAGQWVEVPFRGNGWIFLGETGGQRGIRFDIRRPDSEGQTFVFRADSDGEYTLRFYRRDFVRDVIINDHVQVIVGDTAGTDWVSPPGSVANRVIAERWPNPIDEARILRAAGRLALPDTADTESLYPVNLAEEPQVAMAMPPAAVPAPTPQVAPEPTAPAILPPPVAVAPLPAPVPVPPPVPAGAILQPPVLMPEPLIPDTLPGLGFGSPFDLLPMAMEEFDAGRVAEAISLLDLFRELYPSGTDELWWLLGQFFEADSPSRNILNALGYYRRLVREFPQSSRLSDARSRIAFLERFFLNIR